VIPERVLRDFSSGLLFEPTALGVAKIEAHRVGDAKLGQLTRRKILQVAAELRHASFAETSAFVDAARRAEVVVDVDAVGAGLDRFDDALRDVLAEQRLAGAAPPERHALVLMVGQPRHFVGLALDIPAEALLVGVGESFVVTAKLGDHPDAAEEFETRRVFARFRRGLSAPSERGGTVIRVGLSSCLIHEDDIGALEDGDLRVGSQCGRERQTDGAPGDHLPKRQFPFCAPDP
jgi:hypothetical protein